MSDSESDGGQEDDTDRDPGDADPRCQRIGMDYDNGCHARDLVTGSAGCTPFVLAIRQG